MYMFMFFSLFLFLSLMEKEPALPNLEGYERKTSHPKELYKKEWNGSLLAGFTKRIV